jgi:hypothetical protein
MEILSLVVWISMSVPIKYAEQTLFVSTLLEATTVGANWSIKETPSWPVFLNNQLSQIFVPTSSVARMLFALLGSVFA